MDETAMGDLLESADGKPDPGDYPSNSRELEARARSLFPSEFSQLDVGIGVDTEPITRFEAFLETNGWSALDAVLTEEELADCQQGPRPYVRFAGRFVAKEAILKAVCQLTGEAPTPREIHLERRLGDAPRVEFRGPMPTGVVARVTIAHSDDHAIAFAVAWRSEEEP